jgi:putative chitinase
MVPTATQLQTIAGPGGTLENINSIIKGLDKFGMAAGLDAPHRLAHYIAQLCEESGAFKYDQEIASGAAYEGRADLGNTQPGDGKRFKGRSALQLTGRTNYTAFRDWCGKMGYGAPDFVAHPELINTDPWEGLVPIWFWTSRKLNKLADENNLEQITKKINGGMNGFDVRVKFYVRAALVLLGYGPDDVSGFQRQALADGLLPTPKAGEPPAVDGDAGPKTRAAMHKALATMASPIAAVEVKAAPVVQETEVTVPVVPKGADKPGIMRWFGAFSLTGLGSFFLGIPDPLKYAIAGGVVLLVIAMLWRGEQIALRAKKAKDEIESIFK